MVEEDLREKAEKLFKEISRRLDIERDLPASLRNLCGVDVSYKDSRAFGASIVYDLLEGSIVESVCVETRVKFPYVPGMLYLREAGPMIRSVKRILHDIDLLFVDANGVLHPQRSGLACLIGLMLDKPTIGVAKGLLCGEVKEVEGVDYVLFDDEKVGFVLRRNSGKKLYVSPGHKVSLEATLRFFREILSDRPLPTDLAHVESKRCVK